MHLHSIANNPAWSVLFWVSFYVWFFGFETWVRLRDVRVKVVLDNRDRRSAFFLLVALYVGIFSAIAFAFLAPRFRVDHEDTGLAFFMTGVCLVWFGMLFRYWSIQTLGKYFRTLVLIHDDHQLITKGPYRYLRNPSYTGTVISVLGVGMALGNWLSIMAVVFAVCAGYAWRIRVEESALKMRFGSAYETYAAKTWSLIPFVW